MGKLAFMPSVRKTSSANNFGLMPKSKSPAAEQRGFLVWKLGRFALEDELHKQPSLEARIEQVRHSVARIVRIATRRSSVDQCPVIVTVEQVNIGQIDSRVRSIRRTDTPVQPIEDM